MQHDAPELKKRCCPHLKATNDSWRVDETYIKVKKVWTYLYRAVDSQGNTLEFLLTPTRDAQAAKRFFSKELAALQYFPLLQPSRIRRWNPFMGFDQLVAFAPAQDGSRSVGKAAIR